MDFSDHPDQCFPILFCHEPIVEVEGKLNRYNRGSVGLKTTSDQKWQFMFDSNQPACCLQCELEVPIEAPRSRVWKAIIQETNEWWLPDFRVVDAGSVVTLDPTVGGHGLVESSDNGGWLLWYSVQMILPADFKIYLVGHVAPEWGGPCTSHLKLALVESEAACVLQVSDARNGHVNEGQIQSSADGWKRLFTDGLKKYVESCQ